MNPTPKPKKPKSVARTQKPKKSMKKGGGGKNYTSSRKLSKTTTTRPKLFAPVERNYVLSKNITMRPDSKFWNDHHWGKKETEYEKPSFWNNLCDDTSKACRKLIELLKVKLQKPTPPITPIKEELRTTNSRKLVLKPLPQMQPLFINGTERPMLPLPSLPQSLKPLPQPRSSPKK
jgi:hypothetical protein